MYKNKKKENAFLRILHRVSYLVEKNINIIAE